MWPGPIIDAIATVAGLTPYSILLIGLVFVGLAGATLAVARRRRHRPGTDPSELAARLRSWWVIVSLLTGALLLGRAAVRVRRRALRSVFSEFGCPL